MSRVGKVPVYFDKNVEVSVHESLVTVKGGKSELKVTMNPVVEAKVEDGKVILTRNDDEPQTRAYQGLYRALIQNAVTGVTKGWTKELELNGVGYRAAVQGKILELNVGFSHAIKFEIPEGLEIKVDKQTKVIVTGPDRDLVGRVAAQIRGYRPPEPYLGKGIKYADEKIVRKSGKSTSK